MSSRDFRDGAARLYSERKRGLMARAKASGRLAHELYSYSARYITRSRRSPLLSAAQDCLSEVGNSVSVRRLSEQASAARDLYLEYVSQTSAKHLLDVEVLMMWVATNGFFVVAPGHRMDAQRALAGALELVWDSLDNGYQLARASDDARARTEATTLMQAIFADAQIACGLSFF